MPVIKIITLNTPVREDYLLKKEALKNVTHINVYNKYDIVQVAGGTDTEGEDKRVYTAGRTYPNATNIQYDDQTEFNLSSPGDCGNGNHCGHLEENAKEWLPEVTKELEKK